MPSKTIVLVACVTLISLAGCQSSPAPQKSGTLPTDASVTVFPVLLGSRTSPEVANVVGIMLEKGGLRSVELADAAFTPGLDQDFAAQSAAFGTFVGKQKLKTDYALFAAILGTPGKGIDAVRAAIVDKQGKVVWSETQQKGSEAFDTSKPGEPMDCVMLLAQRLRAPLHLADPMRDDAPPSKLEQRMSEKAGVPPQAEFDAMARRLAALQSAGVPEICVYPPHFGDAWSVDAARSLAAAIELSGIAKVTVVTEPLRFTAKAAPNEQQTLWSAAKSIQQAVRKAPPQQGYLLFADYLMAAPDKAGAVHTFLLDGKGDFVIVDYQNSHHADFQKLAPASAADCSKLAAIRLAACLAR